MATDKALTVSGRSTSSTEPPHEAMTVSGPSTPSQTPCRRSSRSSRRAANASSSRQKHSSRKPKHKFSTLPDVVEGLRYDEYTTSQTLNDLESPFTVYSLSIGLLNSDRGTAVGERIEYIMDPFKGEQWHTGAAVCSSAVHYPQTLPEDIDEGLPSATA
ncbi:hypothetical protein GE09DRAFT_282669 [Coniochaeta sp. 2T2.1]|nr:hypothetical protein GE09DRAFT_282669 [Coniochaeta sp. 2T2.1]